MSGGGNGRRRSGRVGRLVLAGGVCVVGVLLWATLATGTQPYETYEEAVGADGPMAQFRFNDASGSSTIADSVGSYTATNSGITLGGEGPFGGSKSGSFGGEAYASLPSSPLTSASEFTAEAWVDWTGGASYEQPIFDFGSSTTNYMFLTLAGDSKHQLLFEIRTSASKDVQVTATKLAASKWEYVAVTETSSGTLTLYVNGEQVGQTTGATLFPSSLGSVTDDYLGKSQVSTAPMFNGSMSNVAFYGKALSAERIKAHYDAGEYPVNTVAPTISGTAKDGSTLTASKGTWTGLASITYAYQWMLCNASGEGCANISSATETKYTLGHEDVGDTLRVAVTGTNSAGGSTANSAQTAVIAPLAPSNTALPTISGEAESGQLLSVSTGTWKGTPPFSYTYQWQKCNSSGSGCANITGATASSYRILNSQVGDTLRAVVTASNSAGSAKADSAVTATIAAGPPANTELPVISGKAEEGQTLTASTGAWAGTEPFSYIYQWQLCNSSGESCSNLSGATSSTYKLTSSNEDDTLRVIVTAKDSVGSTEAISPQSAVVVGPPVNTSLPTISGTAEDGHTLSASTGVWGGYPAPSYTYQWRLCNGSGEGCSDISGATGSTYVLGHGDVGMTLRVVVTATNSVGSAGSVSEASSVVTAFAPSNTALPTISGIAEEGQMLSTSMGSWEGTPPISYAYLWQDCDSLGEACMDISGATGSGYTLQASDVGSTLRVVVTASNAGGSASASSEASAVVTSGRPQGLIYVSQFGSEGSGDGQFNHPGGIAIGPSGDLFVLDQGNDRVEVFSESGEYLRQFGSEGSGNGQMSSPDGLAVNSEGDVWVLDTGNQRVEEFSENGVFMRTAGAGLIGSAEGIGVDRHGDVWVSATYEGHLLVFNSEGEYLKTVGSEGSGPGQLDEPEGLTVDGNGHVWVAEWANNRVQEFNEAGEYLSSFGSAGSGAGEMSSPYGITAGGDHVFVGEAGNNRVQEFDEEGGFVEQLGTQGSEPGQLELSNPVGLAINSAGDVWITDSGNDRVEEWAPGVPVAPSNTGLPAISGTDEQGKTLKAGTGTWTGTEPFSYEYQWRSCNSSGESCSNISGATESTYVLEHSDVGTTLRVVVTVSNAAGSTPATSSQTAVIAAATPPSNASLPTISGAADDGQTLTASTGAWSGSSPISYAYQWQSCNLQGEECQDVEDATGPSYTLGSGDLETTLRVLVTASNIAGSAQATSAASTEVEPGPPVELEGPSISGVMDVGETLSAHPGTWGGGEAQIGYQWESCNPSGGECQDILGATEDQYTLGQGDIGTTLRVRVAASDEQGAVTTVSPATPVIEATVPTLVNTLASSISGAAQVGQTLTVDPGSWTGEEPITYAYQWQRCDENGSDCEDIAGAEAPSYTPGGDEIGMTLQVLITVTDTNGSISQTAGPTAPVAVEGAPVGVEAPGISGFIMEGQTLTAIPGTWSGDGPLSDAYQWERCAEEGGDCVLITGATDSSYTLTSADVGSKIRVLVTATGPEDSSTGVSPATAVVGPASLLEVSVPSVSGAQETGYALSADPGIWTASGPIAYTYEWERCNASGESCSEVSGASESSYTPVAQDLGSTLRVVVSATSGEEHSTVTSAPTAAIVSPETAPESTGVPSIEGTFTAGDTLSAVPGSWAGAEPLSYSYQWQSCDEEGEECADIEGATESAYVLGEGDVGATIRLVQTATNSLGATSATSTLSEVVGAPGPPATSEGPTIEGIAKEGEKLFVANGAWSGSRPLSYLYSWERCNSAGEACADIEGATNPSYLLSSADVGQTVRVKVTASNSLGAASALSGQVSVAAAGQETAEQAVEVAEQTDPSILAPSTTAELEGQTIAPALTDSGAELTSESVLNSSTVSKRTPGEFAVNTTDGELSLEPTVTATGAVTLPTIVNGAAAVFAGTSTATDTIVRPEPLGASTLVQLRSPDAPTSFSWAVHLGLSQQLKQLPDGGVAVIETSTGASQEASGEEPEPESSHPSTPTEPSSEQGVGGEAAETEHEDYLPESQLHEEIPAAPHVSTPETTPKAGEIEPQNTQAQYESASSALATAEEQAETKVLMVIAPPTVRDAAGNSVAASLSASGETVTMTISPGENATFPVTAETEIAAPQEQLAGPMDRALAVPDFHSDAFSASSHSLLYGISIPYDQVSELEEAGADPHLKSGPGELHPRIARAIVPYNTAPKTPVWEDLEHWLVAAGKAEVTPYITLTGEGGKHEYCTSPSSCKALEPGEQKYGEDVERIIRDFKGGGGGRPPVTIWGAWNEPDLGGDEAAEKHYYAFEPRKAAKIWRYAKAAMQDAGCEGCVMVAGEFAEYKPGKPKFEQEYEEEIVSKRNEAVKIGNGPKRYPRKPNVWGLHDYHDLVYYFERHNNPDATGFDHALIAKVGKTRIWLSEMGVQLSEKAGKETPLATAKNNGKQIMHVVDGKSLPESAEELQAEAAKDFLELGGLPNVEMLDYYEYRSTGGFDSALLPASNKESPREAYCVLALGDHACPPGATTESVIQSATTTAATMAAVKVNPVGLPTNYWLEYGETTAYGQQTTATELPNSSGEQSETVALEALEPCTTYHYQVEAENAANEDEPALGGDKTFKTKCQITGRVEISFLNEPIPTLGSTTHFSNTVKAGEKGTNGGIVIVLERDGVSVSELDLAEVTELAVAWTYRGSEGEYELLGGEPLDERIGGLTFKRTAGSERDSPLIPTEQGLTAKQNLKATAIRRESAGSDDLN
jgi:sugar lactone lactonase YvrE